MDRSWMNTSRMSPAYKEGAKEFLEFVLERTQLDEDEKYFCPYINCLNRRRQVLGGIREHILCNGIKQNFYNMDITW